MNHYFEVEVAEKYGVNAAIILQNLGHWIKRNMANETNYFDGNYWTYNSRRAYRELFPYMSERQIDTAFKKLIDDGLVITGNYNEFKYDRTLWYALTQKGKCILHFDGMEEVKMQNGRGQNVEPIPNINTDIKPNNKPNKRKVASHFTPPTLEEVRNYCLERKNNVNPDKFIDYYTSNGWKVGKNSMKDWKAAVRTWEKNGFDNQSKKKPTAQPQQETDEERLRREQNEKLLALIEGRG